ncbi:hypothetical protein SE17_17925 [Kouleothrix aurantiaca]|uniref:Peptidase M29 n=1 Tax=Kouleothrix aurantiaca TaxID=186479 RepID=A0A0P9CZM5_9CHLR|nr:hypothetical protein SE17_17925 [Kouleothrix aurantiaca]
MPDQRMLKLADVLVNYSAEVRPGDWVLIQGDVAALPLLAEVQRLVTRAGGHPTVMLSAEEIDEAFLSEASPEQLSWLSPLEGIINTQLDVSIRIVAPGNTRALSGIDPARPRAFQQARRDLQRNRMQRPATGKLRWVLTQFPCAALAQEADMSLRDYENFVYAATFADQPDPVAAWETHIAQLARRSDYLNAKQYAALHYTAPGTDLTIGLPSGHIWKSARDTSAGGIDFTPNLPTEEVFTLPHRAQVNGTVASTKPLNLNGALVDGFSLRFVDGRAVEVQASTGGEPLHRMLDTDEGARFLGEVALVPHNSPIAQSGLLFYNTLFDENASCHIALGRAYQFTLRGGEQMSEIEFQQAGGNVSIVHTDFMIGSEAMDIDGITADGQREPVMRAGNWAFEVE